MILQKRPTWACHKVPIPVHAKRNVKWRNLALILAHHTHFEAARIRRSLLLGLRVAIKEVCLSLLWKYKPADDHACILRIELSQDNALFRNIVYEEKTPLCV